MYKTFLINNNIKKDISNLNTNEINELTSTLSKNLKRKMLKILFYNKNIKNEYIESTKDTKLLKVNDKFNTLAFAICITKRIYYYYIKLRKMLLKLLCFLLAFCT